MFMICKNFRSKDSMKTTVDTWKEWNHREKIFVKELEWNDTKAKYIAYKKQKIGIAFNSFVPNQVIIFTVHDNQTDIQLSLTLSNGVKFLMLIYRIFLCLVSLILLFPINVESFVALLPIAILVIETSVSTLCFGLSCKTLIKKMIRVLCWNVVG